MGRAVDPDEAAKRLTAFTVALGSEEAAAAFAVAWLDESKRAARASSSPQAALAAQGVTTRGATLTGDANTLVQRSSSPGAVPLGDVLFGSEFGSDIYTQFARRNQHGYWLFPSADSANVMETFEVEFVDKAIDVATR